MIGNINTAMVHNILHNTIVKEDTMVVLPIYHDEKQCPQQYAHPNKGSFHWEPKVKKEMNVVEKLKKQGVNHSSHPISYEINLRE
jgi:hypothetical protein